VALFLFDFTKNELRLNLSLMKGGITMKSKKAKKGGKKK